MLGLALLASPGMGFADFTTTLTSLSVTNAGNYIIDADAFKLVPPGRSVIAGSMTLKYTRSGGVIALPDGVDYTLRWSLVNAAGVAHPLDTGGDFIETTQPVAWTGGVTEVTLTSTVNLNPAARLDFTKLYRLRVTATPAFGGTGTTYTDAVERFYGHFTNTVSPDAPLNVIGIPAYAEIDRTWVITEGGLPGPTLMGTLFMARYDDFNDAAATANIPVRLRAVMKDVSNPLAPLDVPLEDASADHLQPLANHSTIGDNPATALPTFELVLLPQNLNRAATYQTTAIFEYQEANGDFVSLGQIATAPQSIFTVTGKLMFGDVETRFIDLAGVPTAAVGGRWILSIPAGKAHIKDRPGLTFGGQFVVSLDAAGNATVHETSDAAEVSGTDTEKIAGVRYKRELLSLSHLGAYAGRFSVYFPAGFTVSVPAQVASLPEKNASGKAVFYGLTLTGGAALLPPNPLSLTPLSVRRAIYPNAPTAQTEFFCHHEKLPAWFKASAISLNTATGAFNLVGMGEWRYVRDTEMTLVEALHQPATVPPLNKADTRPSNDSHFRNAHLAHGMESRSMSIQADARGVAVLSARLPLGGGQAEPHYPQGTGVSDAVPGFAFASGVLDIVGGAVNSAKSGVFGVTQIVQRYRRDPRGLKCPQVNAEQMGSFVFQPVGQALRFTEELGLIAEGALTPAELKWGTVKTAPLLFAHRTMQPFTQGVFYQPGFVLPGSVAGLFSENHRAGVLLQSGREKPGGTPADLAYVERPGSAEYYGAGLANYAGLNLRTVPGMEGMSLMDEVDVTYPLKPNGKYYVQRGGVTGRHQRTAGGPALNVTFYGFPTQLTEYKLSFLDNQPKKSFTAGSVEMPFPVGITQAFSELLFNEKGQPISARMAAGPQEHRLAHWSSVPFIAQSIAFHPQKSSLPCTSAPQKNGFIEMGALFTNLGGGIIPGNVTAPLGFKAETRNGVLRGELITLADSEPLGVAVGYNIDSRLHLPPNLKIVVPNGGEYRLNPVTKGCFTDSATATVGGPSGFLSFAGTLTVPFFQEMPVHTHLELAALNPRIHFMGGWKDGAKTFFTDPGTFDRQHLGKPDTLTLEEYRGSTGAGNDDLYRTRAKKCWMDVVDFDFPVRWDTTTRRFASVAEKSTDLLIFDIKHQLRALSGNGAEISFGAEIPELPQLNLQRMVMDELDNATGGHFQKFSTALAATAVQGVNATGITKAVTAIDKMITDRVDAVFEAALGGAVDALLDQALTAAESQVQVRAQQGASLEAQKNAYIQILSGQLTGLQRLKDTARAAVGNVGADAKGLMNFLAGANGQLQDVRKGIQGLRKIIARDPEPNGPRRVFRELTSNLAEIDGLEGKLFHGGVNYLAQALDNLEEVREFTENPFFNDLDAVLATVDQKLGDAIAAIDSGLGGPLGNLAESAVSQVQGEIESRVNAILSAQLPALNSTLRDVAGPGLGQFRADKLRLELRRAILDKIQATVLGDRIQALLRDNFGPLRDVMRGSLDKIIAQITTTVKEAFHEQIAAAGGQNVPGNPLNGLIAEKLPLKQFSEVFQGANLRGYARTYGNSISTLRLDGGIKFKPPGMGTGMEFAGYFEYKDYQKEGNPPEGCLGAAGTVKKACVVSAGASFGSKSRAGKTASGGEGSGVFDNLNVSLDVKFAFKPEGALGVTPLGFTGNQNFRGRIELGIITISELDLKVNFSNANQYLLAYANAQIIQILDAKVWILAGHVCDLSKLKVRTAPGEPDEMLLDRYTQYTLEKMGKALNKTPPSGTEVYGVLMKTIGEISLNDLIEQLSGYSVPKEMIEVSFNRGYTYLYGLTPTPNDLNLLAAMSMFGEMRASLLGYEAASAEAGISGAFSSGFAAWFTDFPAAAMSVFGRADFEAAEGTLKAYLEVSGGLSRDGLRFKPPGYPTVKFNPGAIIGL